MLLNHSYINQVDIKATQKNVWPSITLKDRNHMSYGNGVVVCAANCRLVVLDMVLV